MYKLTGHVVELQIHMRTYAQQISMLMVSKVLERFDSLGQVAEELGHARGEERVDHRAGQESPQICLEEGEHLGAVGFPEHSVKEKLIHPTYTLNITLWFENAYRIVLAHYIAFIQGDLVKQDVASRAFKS